MSVFDGVLIFGGVGLILILPIVAIAGVYYIGRRNKREFRSLIEMDGASCVQTRDDRVTIKSKIWTNFFAFIFLIVVLGLCGLLMVDNLSQDLNIIGDIVLFGFLALTIVPAIIYLWRGLRRPAFYFNPDEQTLTIRQGPSSHRIPFGQMAKLSLETWQKEAGGVNTGLSQQNFIPCAGIKLELTNGETIELGTLSSVTGEKDLWKRCSDICYLVADVTGADLPSELLSGIPDSRE